MILLDSIIFLIELYLLVSVALLSMEVLGALLLSRKRPKQEAIEKIKQSVAILIPAHNEEAVILETIESVIPQLTAGDRIVVVADNCTDNTAELARNNGTEVIERFDSLARGKGYALDFGVQHLKNNPPEIVIIIDADCTIDVNVIGQLTHTVAKNKKPAQALYLMHSSQHPNISQKIATFAFLFKNYVRPLGMKWLGLPCHLMGTGMAFPWQIIESANLANGNIVEDMKLGVDLVLKGQGPIFLPEVKVTSVFPSDQQTSKGQRERWEHGHIDTIVNQVPVLLFEGVKKLRLKTFVFGIDLAIFPLSLQVLVLFAMLMLALVYVNLGGPELLLNIMIFSWSIFGASIFCAWLVFGRATISMAELLSIPFYVIGKFTLYIEYFTNRQKKWIKTKRDDNS